jgi:hypothetical protein
MKDLIEQLKNVKHATETEYNNIIINYSKEQVEKDLKEAGLCKDDLDTQEYEALLKQQIEKSKTFSKGAMAAGGLLMFLEFLG